MLVNETTALLSSKVLLVPYCKHHVPQYHEWMKDPEIQIATASEPLTLEQEFSMQRSWRDDSDKLTFIICQPVPKNSSVLSLNANKFDNAADMIGDVNLFISIEKQDGSKDSKIVGELELMIARRHQQGNGCGKAALLTFLHYVLERENDILDEFMKPNAQHSSQPTKFSYFRAKIGKENHRSIGLFSSLGFQKISEEPNFFKEFEYRLDRMPYNSSTAPSSKITVENYRELPYQQ